MDDTKFKLSNRKYSIFEVALVLPRESSCGKVSRGRVEEQQQQQQSELRDELQFHRCIVLHRVLPTVLLMVLRALHHRTDPPKAAESHLSTPGVEMSNRSKYCHWWRCWAHCNSGHRRWVTSIRIFIARACRSETSDRREISIRFALQ